MALNFRLCDMGWFSFEQLCRTILRTELDQSVEAYSRGRDSGRDGTFTGSWSRNGFADPGVLQCKHRSDDSAHMTLATFKDELPKIRGLVATGMCDSYVLMTSAKVSAHARDEIVGAVSALGVKRCTVYGYETICELISASAELRALVPRMYGLGDLSEILDERRYQQAGAILASMHEDLARLVPVKAHRDAFQALVDHGFVLLVGPPGSGKTSIAGSLALGAIDAFESTPMKLSHIGEFETHWNPGSTTQIFWIDDVFGSNQFDEHSALAWNRAAPALRAAVGHGCRVVCTTRDYVYAQARPDLRTGAFPLLETAAVAIEVAAMTQIEREQILFNHLKLGRQPRDFLEDLRPADLERVAESPQFLPELARRLGDPLFTRMVRPGSRQSLDDFFTKPTDFLLDLLASLGPESRGALGLIHMRGGRLPSPIDVTDTEAEFLARLGVTAPQAASALEVLDGSLLRLTVVGVDRWWEYHHPTFSDAYQAWLELHPEMLKVHVLTAGLGTLLRRVTCGDVGVEGALALPASLYDIVATRIHGAKPERDWDSIWKWRSMAWTFLARRCDDEFLERYLKLDPEPMTDAFDIGLYVGAHGAHRLLATRLLRSGFAGNHERRCIVNALQSYAISGEDGAFLADDEWLDFFDPDELDEMDHRICAETLPRLAQIVEDLEASSQSEADEITMSIAGYALRFPDHPGISEALAATERLSADTDEEPNRAPAWKVQRQAEMLRSAVASRPSIFDDLTG